MDTLKIEEEKLDVREEIKTKFNFYKQLTWM